MRDTPDSSAQQDWAATAQDAQPQQQTPVPPAAAQAAAPQTNGEAADAPSTAPVNMSGGGDGVAQTLAATAPAAPVVITPQKRGGLLDVVDSLADALAGKTRPEIGTDQAGNKYVKTTSLSRGEQWERIAGEALVGGLKGLAAGRGRGNLGAAGAAGVDQGEKIAAQQNEQQKDMSQEAREENLEKANHQILTQKLAGGALEQTAMKMKMSQDAIDWGQKQVALIKAQDPNAQLVGHVQDRSQLAQMMMKTPGFNKDHIQDSLMKPVPTVGDDGNANGFDVYRVHAGTNDEMAPDGTEGVYYDAIGDKLVPYNISGGNTTWGQVYAQRAAEMTKMQEAHIKRDTARKTAADADEAEAKAKNAPLEAGRIKAETAQAWSAAGKNDAERQAALDKAAQTNDPALIDEIGNGKMDAGRLSYLMARNPDLLERVAEKYPDFDSGKIEAYVNAEKEFTSTKPGTAGKALNDGGTALKHLKELDELNTPDSHIPGTPAYRKYQSKAESLSSELAKFYGNTTVSAIAGIHDQLASTLPFNRHAAIITQARSMGDKLDSYEQSWKNAAPSPAYEPRMPGIDQKAMEARAALDPAYKARVVQQQAPAQRTAPAARTPVPAPAGAPPGATHVWNDQQGKLLGYTLANGQYQAAGPQ